MRIFDLISEKQLALLALFGLSALSSFGGQSTPSASADTSLTFSATADTYIRSDRPDNNYGSEASIGTDAKPTKDVLLRFEVSGMGAASVASAKLRLFNVDRSSAGGTFFFVPDNTWDEQSVTWNTAPAPLTTELASLGTVVPNTWYEVDLTSLITGDGTYSLRVRSSSPNGADYVSREGVAGSGPELVVTLGQAPDLTNPGAEITSPVSGDMVSGLVSVDASASDDVGVTGVDLLVDGNVWGNDTNAPFSFQLDTSTLTNGSHELVARASDAAGNLGISSAVTISVDNLIPSSALTFPVRATFYYPWYPETWTVAGQPIHYQPSLGLYDSSSSAVIDNHLDALEYAKIDLGIVSWWGPGAQSESTRLPLLFDRTTANGSPVRWALYYELESTGDPTVSQIQTDLQYAMEHYATRPEYATVFGRPVIFVYSTDSSCDVVDRWMTAAAGLWYVSLKVFTGHRSCANQPDTWHQYTGSKSADQQTGNSYTISPGFWKADESTPRLPRDLERWSGNVRNMVASGEPWQLIVSFNEWGEGTATESAVEWGNAYLDALAQDGGDDPPADQFIFAAAGDHGANARSDASLVALDNSGADFYLALGDLDYDQTATDDAWCDYVKDRLPILGDSFPFQIVAGNHEEQGGPNGYIVNHAACLPDRVSSTTGPGSLYGAEYYFDYPLTSPLMRVIMISPGLTVENVDYRYAQGEPRYAWLVGAIDSARAAGIAWVAVGMHKDCITTGEKSCEIGVDLMNLLVEKKVDLVLQGHEHNYQRSKQLALNPSTCPTVVIGSYQPGCVVDDGFDGVYPKGAGSIIVISGTFGQNIRPVDLYDPEAPYFARIDSTSSGLVKFIVTSERIDADFVSSVGAFSDTFSLVAGAPPGADTELPTTPTGLVASATSSNRVELSWNASTDNVTVDRYDVFRDGASIASVNSPFFSDTSATGGRTYTYWIIAYDAAGNPSSSSIPAMVDTPGATSLVFLPVADATIRVDKPTVNLGQAIELSTDGSPTKDFLLQFTVSGVGSAAVANAKLRLYSIDSASVGGIFYRVLNNSWTEETVTWNASPTSSGAPVATLGAVVPGLWYEVDLTSLIVGDGTFSLRVTSTSSNGADYTSKEGAIGFRPELVLTLSP